MQAIERKKYKPYAGTTMGSLLELVSFIRKTTIIDFSSMPNYNLPITSGIKKNIFCHTGRGTLSNITGISTGGKYL